MRQTVVLDAFEEQAYLLPISRKKEFILVRFLSVRVIKPVKTPGYQMRQVNKNIKRYQTFQYKTSVSIPYYIDYRQKSIEFGQTENHTRVIILFVICFSNSTDYTLTTIQLKVIISSILE